MKWYFTPDLGQFGAAVEIDSDGNMCRVAYCIVTPDGQMAFLKWAPPSIGACKAKSYQVAPYTLYETTDEQSDKLKGLFGNVILPANGRPRLIT